MKQAFREIINDVQSSYFAYASQNMPTTFPEHWHTLAEIILARKDDCTFSVNGERILLNRDEVLIFWPTELHSTIKAPEDSYIVFQFSASLITDCKDFNIYYHSLRNIHRITDVSKELNHSLCIQLGKIEALHRTDFAEPKILILIYEMLMVLCQHIQEHQQQTNHPFHHTDPTFTVMKKACSYIDENCDRNLTQAEVAQYCDFSPYYFSKLFHKYTSETFPEYLAKRRIELSAQLLLSSSYSVADVSSLSGFQSISNFNKLFKKHYTCTPLQYRKLYSQNNHVSVPENMDS